MRDLPRKQAIGLAMAGLRKRGGCHDLTGLGIAKIACHVTVGSWRLLDPFGKHPFDLFLRALRGLLVDRMRLSGYRPAMTTTLFTNGRSQAVRIPKELRFEGREVSIRRLGDGVLLVPVKASTLGR